MAAAPVRGDFDERQKTTQQRSGQTAFFVMLAACLLNAAVMTYRAWGTPIQQAAGICFAGLITWLVPVVWRGAYWYSSSAGWFRIAASVAMTAMWGYFAFIRGPVWQGSHAGAGFENFMLALLFGVITVLGVVRLLLDQHADEA